jgi:hypothetical protein
VILCALTLAGCAEQELREQSCAKLALLRHGPHRPTGVYGTWTHGTRCNARLWNGEVVHEGPFDGPVVYDLGPDHGDNGFECLGKCHRDNFYDVKISADQRYCYCRSDKVSD